IDTDYIPPLLSCEAWKPLSVGILQELYDRIGQRVEQVTKEVIAGSITFDSQGQGDAKKLAQLSTLNEAYGLLGGMVFAQGVHPFVAYLEFCRLVGRMAIFGESCRTPSDLPRYDHDDLGPCFYRLFRLLSYLLDRIEKPIYQERAFVGAGLRMQVSIEPA